ncbi:MAG: hypothetical protein HQ517_16615 [SAR324 cluster bacterium]|nr:hypothetical protein [SAR324 cluster bacterium]
MAFSIEEAASALAYIKQLRIIAELNSGDGKTLFFNRIPVMPESFSEDIQSILEICIEYHQRSVFTGEHLSQDKNPPLSHATNPLDEINYFLEHYKPLLIKEVEKGLDIAVPSEKDLDPERKISPYAKAMLKHRAEQRKNKSE